VLDKRKLSASQRGMVRRTTHLTKFATWVLPEPWRALFSALSVEECKVQSAECGEDDEPKSWRVVPRYEQTRQASSNELQRGIID
jgi:hypothetical protein